MQPFWQKQGSTQGEVDSSKFKFKERICRRSSHVHETHYNHNVLELTRKKMKRGKMESTVLAFWDLPIKSQYQFHILRIFGNIAFWFRTSVPSAFIPGTWIKLIVGRWIYYHVILRSLNCVFTGLWINRICKYTSWLSLNHILSNTAWKWRHSVPNQSNVPIFILKQL